MEFLATYFHPYAASIRASHNNEPLALFCRHPGNRRVALHAEWGRHRFRLIIIENNAVRLIAANGTEGRFALAEAGIASIGGKGFYAKIFGRFGKLFRQRKPPARHNVLLYVYRRGRIGERRKGRRHDQHGAFSVACSALSRISVTTDNFMRMAATATG